MEHFESVYLVAILSATSSHATNVNLNGKIICINIYFFLYDLNVTIYDTIAVKFQFKFFQIFMFFKFRFL